MNAFAVGVSILPWIILRETAIACSSRPGRVNYFSHSQVCSLSTTAPLLSRGGGGGEGSFHSLEPVDSQNTWSRLRFMDAVARLLRSKIEHALLLTMLSSLLTRILHHHYK
jgi:hypothetical protein